MTNLDILAIGWVLNIGALAFYAILTLLVMINTIKQDKTFILKFGKLNEPITNKHRIMFMVTMLIPFAKVYDVAYNSYLLIFKFNYNIIEFLIYIKGNK